MTGLWDYDAWPSKAGLGWHQDSKRGESPYDQIDFHVDLGCGKLSKGRIGVDRYPAPGVGIVADLDKANDYGNGVAVYGMAPAPGEAAGWYDGRDATLCVPGEDPWTYPPGSEWRTIRRGLPFGDSSIKSIISHHFFEHVGLNFIALVEECYRVLEPGGILRAITPLFPSWDAVSDPDHRRWFLADGEHCTWDSFCGTPDNCWLESFSVPYTTARFEKVDQDHSPRTPASRMWTAADNRELRVALKAVK